MTSLLLFGATEGGLFDFDATLPLMAAQVVLLTFILNALFFKPVGRVVEEREGYISTSRAEAKQKLAEVEKLETDLRNQLKEARKSAQKVITEAEEDSDKLYKEAQFQTNFMEAQFRANCTYLWFELASPMAPHLAPP